MPASTGLSDGGILRPLAVVGMSFRFPGGSTSDNDFWDMLVSKRCASTDVPPDRFNIDAHYNPDTKRLDTLSCRGGHYLDGQADVFDASFFGIGASEASSMDPLHRISLEESYRALENAGLSLQDVAGTKTCVFSGCLSPDYVTICHKDTYAPNQYHASGSAINMLANRVSWWFDLRGPSVTVDTACSSSLVALDLACQSIWAGDATMGLVCGANMMLTPESQLYLNNLGMLSKDSRSYSFDERANGYGRGEGVGVVVVQPLDDAIRDGRTIRAVIRSTCSNQDGKTPGITQPSKEAQYRLILDTYAKAGLSLNHTRYFEAHGTGTPLGDPIEAGAIGQAFRAYRSPHDPLYLGSVKSNIGHLEGGSGVAGLIKTILALENGVIAPNADFKRLNPKIDADFLNLKVAANAVPWPSAGLRRASVQSFGFGGSNSHVVLDDALNFMRLHGLRGNHKTNPVPRFGNSLPDSVTSDVMLDALLAGPTVPVPRLLVWSTADEGGIARTRDAWRNHPGLASPPAHCRWTKERDYLGDVAYTLAARRTHFPWRAMAVVTSAESLGGVADMMSGPTRAAVSPQLGLVFTGQGSQWYAMGRELFGRYALYRKSVLDAGHYLATLGCTWDPIAELMQSETKTNVNKPLYSSLCTILQVALVDVLYSFDVQPAAVVGHSSGEIAAAYCAGALSRESAWKIAYYRGLLASQLAETSTTKGSMMAVGLAADKAQPYLDRVTGVLGECRLTVACINSPASITVSGEEAHVDHLKGMLDADKVFCRKLRVGVAYHSFQMQEMADQYLEKMACFDSVDRPPKAALKYRTERPPRRPAMVSSVTGTWTTPEAVAKPEYWVHNLVSPVLFADALAAMTRPQTGTGFKKLDGSHSTRVSVNTLVEVGPHSALQAPIREILRDINMDSTIAYVPLLSRGASAVESLLGAMGRLHCLGHPLALTRVNAGDGREQEGDMPVTITTLPPYTFNHSKSYWFESRASRGYRLRQHPAHPHLGAPEADFNPLEAKWRKIIRTGEMPWVEDHKINGTILYPAAGMLAMAIEAANQLANPGKTVTAFVIKNVTLHSALNLPSNAPSVGVEVNLFMRPRRDQDGKNAGWFDFRLCTHDDSTRTWFENCHGSIQVVYEPDHEDTDTGGRAPAGIDKGREERLWCANLCREYQDMAAACSTTLEIGEFYARLAEWGFDYGPAFRDMTAVASDGHGGAAIEVKTFESPAGTAPYAEHIVHPATLDCIFQSIIVSMTNAGTARLVTGIPTHFDHIWLSATGLSHPHVQSVKAYGKAKRLGLRQTETSIGVVDVTGSRALLKIDGFVATDISGSADDMNNTDEQTESSNSTPLCHTIEWRPDLNTLSNDAQWSSIPGLESFELILDAIAHKTPSARILQVGAGASVTATDELMKVLAPEGVPPRFGVFDCTDIDPSFHDTAQEKYRHHGPTMRFLTLDIEAAPEDQGLEVGTYDIVVAATILHTTVDPANALKHCRLLLKPGGKLVVWHLTDRPDATHTQSVTGLVKEWWRGTEPGQEPLVPDEAVLSRLLASAGFGEKQTIVPHINFANAGANSHEPEFNIIISAAVETSQPPAELLPAGEINIIHGLAQHESALELQRYMSSSSRFGVRVLGLNDVNEEDAGNESIYVFLLELGQPVWHDIARETFVHLQKLLAKTSKAIWVQKGAGPSPQFRLIDGVSRVLNSELDTAALTLLRLEGDDSCELVTPQMGHILRLCQQRLASDDVDTEYCERGGMLHIPRLVSRPKLNAQIESRLGSRRHVTRPWHAEHEVPLRLAVGSPGLLNTLHWAEDTENTPDAPLGDTDVEIRVHSVGLNFRDLLMVLGRVNHSGIGSDVAGIVTRLGRGCEQSGLRVGDRVAGCRMNSFRSLVRCPRAHVVKIPDSMSLTDAASLPTTFVTAWQCLNDRARLRAGETVLIHSAAGGTGQAAVQVARHLGAIIIVTVGTEDKKKLLVERYGLDPDHVLSSRDTSFARGVVRLTGGRGVDVVFNSLSGEGLVASWECVAPFGRFVEIGKKDIIASNALPMAQFARNVSFSAYDLSEMLLERAEQAGAALQQVVTLIDQKNMSPAYPLQVFSAGDVEKAFRALQSGKTMGKIVVEFRPDEQVEALIETKPSLSLDPNASYVIAGGLGGLGRAIARWFVGRGARTLILPSRSAGARTHEAQELVRELRGQGVKVVIPACDISDPSAVAALFASMSPGLPIIKGCIQASMVLRDAAFEAMSFDAWQESVASKVAGTWNLHEALPRGMDFFIMLSSIASTCGSRGQANYAAGNAFQNAVAHYRVAAGERATALALGPFFDVGVMAKNSSLQGRYNGQGVSGVTETELLALLDYYCDSARPADADACEPTVMRFAPGIENKGSKLAYVMRKPMFRGIKAALAAQAASSSSADGAATGRGNEGRVDFARFSATKPTAAEAASAVSDALATKLAETLSMSRDELDMAAPIHSFGVDSLVAVEIRNWLSKELRADVAIFDILEASSVAALGASAVGKSGYFT
ncbi:putative polyketide synthase [Podospora appendiculata]|uniref:Polyketide synthase n=1 Tax=Podospora appendiculata TaxID=314037 RepID=A0AAE0X896_9PEZI|nr:putative polyketide synthase [Podospora appendiculata]